jgi:hypothetical protein
LSTRSSLIRNSFLKKFPESLSSAPSAAVLPGQKHDAGGERRDPRRDQESRRKTEPAAERSECGRTGHAADPEEKERGAEALRGSLRKDKRALQGEQAGIVITPTPYNAAETPTPQALAA